MSIFMALNNTFRFSSFKSDNYTKRNFQRRLRAADCGARLSISADQRVDAVGQLILGLAA